MVLLSGRLMVGGCFVELRSSELRSGDERWGKVQLGYLFPEIFKPLLLTLADPKASVFFAQCPLDWNRCR
jgi:hypothetical protein